MVVVVVVVVVVAVPRGDRESRGLQSSDCKRECCGREGCPAGGVVHMQAQSNVAAKLP